MNLFEIARANGSAIEDQLLKLMGQCEPESKRMLEEFLAWVREVARVSINLTPAVLSDLLARGTYQNIHEWAEEQAFLSGRSKGEILRERLGRYYDRRIVFDAAFDDGDKFRYGALNAGGVGFGEKFGAFCIVLSEEILSLDSVAYLPNDSLTCCFDDSGKFDEARIKAMVASNSHRHCLAGIKHSKTVDTIPKDSWARVVLKDDDYIEAIFTGGPSLKSIAKVRVSKKAYDELNDLACTDFTRKRSDCEKALVIAFAGILRAVREGRISLEVLE